MTDKTQKPAPPPAQHPGAPPAPKPAAPKPAAPAFKPKPLLEHPTPFVAGEHDPLKIVHVKDKLMCTHGGTVNLAPTPDRDTEISEYPIVTDKDLIGKVTSKGCTITGITTGLSRDIELSGGAIPVLRNLVAATDKGCTVVFKGFELDIDHAADYLDQNKEDHMTGNCARYVMNAVREGMHTPIDGANADKMGGPLTDNGFHQVTSGTYEDQSSFPNPQKGDVAVFDPVEKVEGDPKSKGHPYGHTTMWDGEQWVSDGPQGKEMSSRPYDYKGHSFKIYRSAGRQAHAGKK